MSGNQVILLGLNSITAEVANWCTNNGINCKLITNAKLKNGFLANGSNNQELNFKVIELDNISEIESVLPKKNTINSLNISVGAPWIIPPHIINDAFGNNIYNLHGTYLPRDRGGNLFTWQILAERRTGICLLHKMTSSIDGGGIVKYKEFIYPDYCRLPKDFIVEYDNNNIQFLTQIIQDWKNNILIFEENHSQPEYLSTYWPRLMAPVNGWINWNWDGNSIEKFICAFDVPYPGARTHFRNKTVILRNVYFQRTETMYHPFQIGIVHRKSAEWLNVTVDGGELLICGVYDVDGNSMFEKIKPGDRFFTKQSVQEESLRRVVKTSSGLGIQKDLEN